VDLSEESLEQALVEIAKLKESTNQTLSIKPTKVIMFMPYISDYDKREALDKIVEQMYKLGIEADGDLNYLLYAYLVRHIPRSYNSIKNYCGELNECAEEIRRRILGPHEDQAIKRNGDVY